MQNFIFSNKLNELINPCFDPVFKSIFTKDTPESKQALRGLVSAILQKDLKVVDVTTNEPPVNDTGDKQIRYDINCVLDDGDKANVEMTIWPDLYEVYRMEYYLARLHTTQTLKGKKKGYKTLRQSYQISIFAKDTVFKDNQFFHRFIYHDPERRIDLGGRTAIFTVELRKLEEIVQKPVEELTGMEMWAIFFAYFSDPSKQDILRQIIEMEEEIGMAQAMMQRITATELEALKQISRDKYEIDKYSREYELELREERGLTRGKVEGAKQTKHEIARKMYEQGISVEQILAITGLSPDIATNLQ